MKNTSLLSMLILIFLSCQGMNSPKESNRVALQSTQDNCDNPDADVQCCFVNMPQNLTKTMNIGGKGEPGERLVISGRVLKANGKTPVPNVILYAYHTDSKGYYSKTGTETGVQKWHGRLHGWCKTDSQGNYEINTIRPARYPDNSMPAHIHAVIRINDKQMFWISDFVFSDDKLVNERYISSLRQPGGTGVVDLKKTDQNTWTGTRDIVIDL